jgi:hypothetical protein
MDSNEKLLLGGLLVVLLKWQRAQVELAVARAPLAKQGAPKGSPAPFLAVFGC